MGKNKIDINLCHKLTNKILSGIEERVKEGRTTIEVDFDDIPELNIKEYKNYILYFLDINGFIVEESHKKQKGWTYINCDKVYEYVDCDHLYIKWHPTFRGEKLDPCSMAYYYYKESKKR